MEAEGDAYNPAQDEDPGPKRFSKTGPPCKGINSHFLIFSFEI